MRNNDFNSISVIKIVITANNIENKLYNYYII